MTDRIFQQYAQGFGATPCQVVCQIDGNTVFDGSVTTVNQSVPYLPNLDFVLDNLAWSWTNDATYSGTQTMSISVSGSPLLLGATLANNPYDVANAAVYLNFYTQEIDGVYYADPFTDESIDGVLQTVPNDPDRNGQRWWTIPAGSTFTAIMHVQGLTPPPA